MKSTHLPQIIAAFAFPLFYIVNQSPAVTTSGVGLDGVASNSNTSYVNFGAARSLSGDGSTFFFQGNNGGDISKVYDADTDLLSDYSDLLGFSISDIGFAASEDGSLAIAFPIDSETEFWTDAVVIEFDGVGRISEQYPLSDTLGSWLHNPVFIGETTSLVAIDRNHLLRVAPLQTQTDGITGITFVEAERHTFSEDTRLMNLGSNASGQVVGFYEKSNSESNFNITEAGFYLVGESDDSFEQFSLDFSDLLDPGAVLEIISVYPENMSPGGRYVLINARDSLNGSRSFLYDFEQSSLIDLEHSMPGNISDQLAAMFPDNELDMPSNPAQLIERVDANKNLIGRARDSDYDTVGTFILTNTPAPLLIGLEEYIDANYADALPEGFTEAVELTELLVISEDNSAILLGGIDADGFYDAFLINRDSTSWYDDAVELGDGWRWFDWFKSFKPVDAGWIYHELHGWLYVAGDNPDSEPYLWDGAMSRWLWTSETIYPWIYAFGSEGGWLFFFENGSPGARFFARGGTAEILSEAELTETTD